MLSVTVTGMTCGHCVRAVNDALSALPGVDGVTIDLQSGRVLIGGEPDVEAVRTAVEEEGYKVL